MPIPGWLEWANSSTTIPLQVAGFGWAIGQSYFAWQEAKKARTAAEATQAATRETVRKISRHQLLLNISNATTLITSLNNNFNDNNLEAMPDLLREWQLMLSGVVVLIREHQGPNVEVEEAVKASSSATLAALSAIRKSDAGIFEALTYALDAADRVWTSLTEVQTQISVGSGNQLSESV